MLNQLLVARAVLAHAELDMESHASLHCTVGGWRRSFAEATDWLRLQLGAAASRH